MIRSTFYANSPSFVHGLLASTDPWYRQQERRGSMGGKVGQPRKYQREIAQHRRLYENKSLHRVRDNWVLYWRFLAHLEDIGYRPRTVERYHEKLRTFLRWLEGRSVRRVRRSDVEVYLLYVKSERQRVAYTIRYVREVLASFFERLMGFAA
jgi:site-specific recombinase XerD